LTNISERFRDAGETCYNIASQRTFLTAAFFGAVAAYPFSGPLAIGVLGAPAIYAAAGFTWKATAKAIDYLNQQPPEA
jgi:hypothetical protein